MEKGGSRLMDKLLIIFFCLKGCMTHDKEKNLIMNFRYWGIKWLLMYDLEEN
jgi:hypothetical protein